MDPRPKLQQTLKALFDRNPHVYHNGPGKGSMVYPCIVYKLTSYPDKYADNEAYLMHRQYQLTVIDTDPDSELRERVAQMKWCRFARAFVSDNLHHFVFNLYF